MPLDFQATLRNRCNRVALNSSIKEKKLKRPKHKNKKRKHTHIHSGLSSRSRSKAVKQVAIWVKSKHKKHKLFGILMSRQ